VRDDSPSEFVTVQVRQGWLRGRQEDEELASFLGVPYAAPPVGSLRWRPPQPAAGWQGVRDALAFGPDFPQAPNPRFRAARQEEDCLYLNVWTPSVDAGAALPVMVWLHGGGFTGGSGSDQRSDGARLAREGVVVVSLNYRSGLFGFLAHPALSRESAQGVSGNYGLLDQLAALAWVRENVDSFGGDPSRITAFGVSAGSASLSLLLASPQAKGAFDRAILHSPGAGRPLATLREAEEAGLRLGPDLVALRARPA
jgi:para-nitrobenzyl esterase